MSHPLEDFRRVVAEEEPIVETIKGERFEFPAEAPSEIALDFLATVIEKPDTDLNMLAVYEFSQMLGEDEIKRLTKVTSFKALQVLVIGLFTHYGLLSKGEVKPPNRQARRASKKASSGGSARSDRGSAATTRSSSPEPSKT